METRIKLVNTNVKSVLLYGADTWRMSANIINKVQTINTCLRKKPNTISNRILRHKTSQLPAQDKITEALALDSPHPQEANIKHHQASSGLKEKGKEEPQETLGSEILRQIAKIWVKPGTRLRGKPKTEMPVEPWMMASTPKRVKRCCTHSKGQNCDHFGRICFRNMVCVTSK